MSNRPEPLTAAQQADLGRVVRVARANGVPWKCLEREFGRCERQLRRYALMSELSERMSDLRDCGSARTV